MSEPTPILSAHDVSRSYQNGDVVTQVLHDVSLDVRTGEFLVLLGESGSGKSTLMNILAGMDVPSSGFVEFQGARLTGGTEQELAVYRREHVGFVFQSHNLMPELTAQRNVELAASLVDAPLSAERVLDMVGLAAYRDRLPSELSGGQRQRVAIARALVKRPALIFADEPTAALDHEASAEVIDVIRQVASAGTTVVMVTHDEQVSRLADRVMRVRDGRIVEVIEQGQPERTLQAPDKRGTAMPEAGAQVRSIWLTDLLTTIRATAVPFLSILIFSLLGVGMFLGIQWVTHALTDMADQALAEAHAHDLEISFPYGLDEDDLAQLSQVEGVDEVEACYLGYRSMAAPEGNQVVRVLSLPQRIDLLLDVEGTLPRDEHEIALERSWAASRGLEVGSTVTFDPESEGGKADDAVPQPFRSDSYTVTALVNSPSYLGLETNRYGNSPTPSGEADGVAWLTEDAFNQKAFFDARPYVVLRSNALDGLPSFGDAYRSASADLKARVTELGDRLADERFSQLYQQNADLVADAEKRLADARKQLEEGKAQAAQGAQELEEGRTALERESAAAQQELASAQQTLEQGQRVYDAAVAQQRSAQAQLAEARQAIAVVEGFVRQGQDLISQYHVDLTALRDQYLRSEISLEQYQAQIDAAGAEATAQLAALGIYPSIPLTAAYAEQFLAQESDVLNAILNIEFSAYGYTMTLANAPAVIEDAQAQLDRAQAELTRSKAQLDQGRAELAEAQARYERETASAQERLDAGEKELAQSREQLSAGEKEIAARDAELKEGRAALDELRTYRWVVVERSYNPSILLLDTYVYIMRNVRWTMALPFFLVGLLVCYAAVGRMVHDHKELIGTKKAIGFFRGEIARFYLAYSALAVLLGVALAVPLALYVIEHVIASSLQVYFVRPFQPYLRPSDIALLGMLQLGLIALSTWLSARDVVRRQAAELLSGEVPPTAHRRFFERWKLWSRLGLLGQTIVNNCLNDARRVIATVVGVAGCAALVVTAVTLYDNVYRANERMYDAIFHFDSIVYIEQTEQARKDALAALRDAGMDATPVHSAAYTLEQSDGYLSAAAVIVPYDYDEFVRFYNPLLVSERRDEHGMIMNMSYRDHLGAQVGDQVTLTDAMGSSHVLPISGFFEYYYALNQIIMEEELFERSFADVATPNRLLVDSKGAGAARVAELLQDVEGYQTTVDDYGNAQKNFDAFFSVAQAVVGVYLALAAVMAFVVVLNLDVMFVTEKKRELIVLMVNGFSQRQAKAYIWHDAVLLTVVGILCGLVLGGLMGLWTVMSVESHSMEYFHDVSWLAMGLGSLVSAVFSTIALLIALRRIPKLDLSDLNRL